MSRIKKCHTYLLTYLVALASKDTSLALTLTLALKMLSSNPFLDDTGK